MKKVGYWIGMAMFGLLALVILIGFIVRNGWDGAVFLAFIGIAGLLVICCAENE